MHHLNQFLLAATGLSPLALAGILPGHHPEIRHCAPGTKMCHGDTVYRCSSQGKWVGNIQCIPPAHCFEDKHTQDAGCVGAHADLKRSAPVQTPAPSLAQAVDGTNFGSTAGLTQATTLTPVFTRPGEVQPTYHTGDLRCNGRFEEMWDDNHGWQRLRECADCSTISEGIVDCTPIVPELPHPTPCKENQFRCNGDWQEYCEHGYKWKKLQKCLACSQLPNGITDCVPDVLPSDPPARCKEGTMRCHNKWLQLCDWDRQWHSIEECAACEEGNQGETYCRPLDLKPDTVDSAAPTQPAASPTVPRMTATNAAVRTPAPDPVPFPTMVSRAAPDVGVAEDNPCFRGEVKCHGDRVDVCMASHQWMDFGPCPNCKLLYNTKVNCTWDFAEQASNAKPLLIEFTAPESFATPVCEKGWQRCSHSNTTVESCDTDGKWAHKQTCDSAGRCVGIREGVAFCLDKKTAEKEVRNFGI